MNSKEHWADGSFTASQIDENRHDRHTHHPSKRRAESYTSYRPKDLLDFFPNQPKPSLLHVPSPDSKRGVDDLGQTQFPTCTLYIEIA